MHITPSYAVPIHRSTHQSYPSFSKQTFSTGHPIRCQPLSLRTSSSPQSSSVPYQLVGHLLYLNGHDIGHTHNTEVNDDMLTLGHDLDPSLCRISKIFGRNNKFQIDRSLKMESFDAKLMCKKIANPANVPSTLLIIKRATVSINAAREELHLIWVEHY
jgi:hypothetical protein